MRDVTATRNVGSTPAGRPTAPTAVGRRLAWLDALRGFGALVVVFDHLGYYDLQQARLVVYQWFRPGLYGVFVFFLISGYIVPASLERKGSIRTFWVSRIFRLYPLFLLVMGWAVALRAFDLGSLRGASSTPETSALGSALMMSNVLGVPNAVNVIWTLSYEMVFYLLLTALFVTGTHRRSHRWALGFAAAAVALAGVLPRTALSGGVLPTRLVAVLVDVAIVVGVALAVSRHKLPKTAGAVLAGGTAVLLAAVNGQWLFPWEALSILAVMFTGTMIYRAERGQFPKPRAAVLAVVVFACVLAAGLWHSHGEGMSAARQVRFDHDFTVTMVAVAVTFAVGLACRHRRVPSALAWLGLISYSIYLVHPVLIDVYQDIPVTHGAHPLPIQVLLAAAFFAVVIATSALTYYCVEAPMQKLGRAMAGALDTWFGPERSPGSRAREPAETSAS